MGVARSNLSKVCVGLWAATSVVLPPADPASALAGRDGPRPTCTITGTAGDDVLTGTRRADVICGRGGDDTIRGRGGNDLVIAGAGRDRVWGGRGDDTLRAGPGVDVVSGGADVDLVAGGNGGDELLGDAGRDVLAGQTGDDYLDGGPQADVVDGGAGDNSCTGEGEDEVVRCAYDIEEPVLAATEFVRTDVDVTEADQVVTLRARVTDDIGITGITMWVGSSVSGARFHGTEPGKLVAGTARDGWWEQSVTIPRYARPGTYDLRTAFSDAIGHWRDDVRLPGTQLEVTSAAVDTAVPIMHDLLEPAPGTVLDVRESDAELTVRARITDDLSGLESANVCARPVNHYQAWSECANLMRVSGTELDGSYRAVIPIPHGSMTDEWKLTVELRDSANPWSPTWHTSQADEWGSHFTPAGAGTFQVVGSDPPVAGRLPEVSSLAVTPAEIDTLSGPATVSAVVEFDDPDGVLQGGSFALQQTREGGWTRVDHETELEQGEDGRWHARLVVPQGSPPGRYQIRVIMYVNGSGWVRYLDHFVTVVDTRP